MPKLTKYQKEAEGILDNFVTIGAVFQPFSDDAHMYTFKCHKDWLNKVKINDLLLVQANQRFAVVQIKRIDDKVKNPNDIKLSWPIQRVNMDMYNKLMEQDKQMARAQVDKEQL